MNLASKRISSFLLFGYLISFLAGNLHLIDHLSEHHYYSHSESQNSFSVSNDETCAVCDQFLNWDSPHIIVPASEFESIKHHIPSILAEQSESSLKYGLPDLRGPPENDIMV